MIDGIGSGGRNPPAPPRPAEVSPQAVQAAQEPRGPANRRERRMQWLASVREALDEALPLVDEMAAPRPDSDGTTAVRASIAEALAAVNEMSGRIGDPAAPAADALRPGETITAAELARRIAVAADLALEAQARLGPGAVRRLIREKR
ncbi:MAG TPA: hypothetical protein VFL92_07120 [Sphingomonas sp.]|nr:hypothetical protein [Sphingomonas sp.]